MPMTPETARVCEPPRTSAVALVLAAVTLTSACTATDTVVPIGAAVLLVAGVAHLATQHRRRPRDWHEHSDGINYLFADHGSRGDGDDGGRGNDSSSSDCGDSGSSDGGGGDGGGCGGGGD